MKTQNSPENEEITPTKKKLKQARLPFKILSDDSTKTETPPSRKRKLSAPEAEPVTKLGKVAKENDLIGEAVVISDDDSKDGTKSPKEDKPMNPFVKLIDTAWKKKLQKSKSSKKKKGGNKKSLSPNKSKDATESGDDDRKKYESIEIMEVDSEEVDDKLSDNEGNKEENDESKANKQVVEDTNEVEVLEDSNNAPECEDKNSQQGVSQEDTTKEDSDDQKTDPNKEKDDSKDGNEVVILEDSNHAPEQVDKNTKKDAVQNGQIKLSSNGDLTKVPSKDNDSSDNEDNTEDNKMSDSEESERDKDGDTSISVEKDNKDSEGDTSISVTPKRSTRNGQKAEQQSKLNSSQLSNGDQSASSTPRRSTRSCSLPKSQGDVSLNDSLTPRQTQKKLELAKKKEDREKEKQEREMKRQQEKEERAKQRLEKEEQRKREKEEKEEAKRKEREEKEEQKRKEREEKEKQKEMEKKLKEEKEEQKRKEKEEKEEQKRKEKEAREEEKRKKQEALEQEKLEQEQKKKKAAEAFVNFFVPKQKVEKDHITQENPVSQSSVLSSFTIKSDMRLAPTVRTNLTEEKRQNLDDVLKEQNVSKSSLYINRLKERIDKPLFSGKTWPMDDKDDDVMIVEDELPMDGAGEILACDTAVREKLRPKLLSFHENRRPPYWGTWRKKSTHVTPRRPFTQDQKHLDYEVDSDEEWEEEQEGESIDGSAAGSDDEQDADEYEVDNELFVPHGYLSDEEATMDEDDVLSLSPEAQKARLKHLEDEFESELKKPTEKLKPRLYGLLWETSDGSKPEKCVDALWNYFGKLAMIMNDPTPLLQPSSEPEEAEKKKIKKKKSLPESENQSPKSDKKKKKDKESKTSKIETKKNVPELKKNQPEINSFLTISKVKS